jgi:hypothetical protein
MRRPIRSACPRREAGFGRAIATREPVGTRVAFRAYVGLQGPLLARIRIAGSSVLRIQ